MSNLSVEQNGVGRLRPFLKTSFFFRLVAIGLLLLLWGRLLNAANQQSATFDESIHLLHGMLFWREASLFSVVQNPPLLNALMGAPLALLFQPQLPPFDASIVFQDWLKISQVFLWQVNSNGLLLLWVGRWVIMVLTVLLGAIVFRFAGQLYCHPLAGGVALFLLSFDPNILAHGSLATTDLGISFFLTLAVYCVWRYWAVEGKRPFSLFAAVAVSLGLAFGAKFTAVILIPALLMIICYRWVVLGHTGRVVRREATAAIIWITLGVLIFLLLYRFEWTALQTDYQLQQEHQLSGHSAFLHGELSQEGWWYYFPLTFLIKTPIATLILLVWGVLLSLWRRSWPAWDTVWLLLPAGAIFASGFVSQVNIGYRYMLPALPLLFVLSGNIALAVQDAKASTPKWRVQVARYILAGCFLSLSLFSMLIHPNYLAYFNSFIGGSANGWRWLVDSNLDWGQELIALADYEKTHLAEPYQVAWLGSAPLEAYGIENGRPAPIWPQGREEPLTDPFYPPAPAPGTYVLSATQLHGVYLENTARFAWFLTRPPSDRIGYALFVYDVPPTGPRVGLGLSGIGPAMIAPEDYEFAFGSNDVAPRWFDARTTFLWPGGASEVVWTAVGTGHMPQQPLLTAFYPPAGAQLAGSQELADRLWEYSLFEWRTSPMAVALTKPSVSKEWGWSPEPVVGAANWAAARRDFPGTAVFANRFRFLGYQISTAQDAVEMLTFWRVEQTPEAELKIFVHLLDADGQVVAQHDGLDVQTDRLRAGDEFAQLHTMQLPAELPAGIYGMQIGLYQAADGTRLRLPAAGTTTDRLLLTLVTLDR